MAGDITQFFGSDGPVSSIVNYYSSGGVQSAGAITANSYTNTKETLSGALVATTLKTIHSVTGHGRLNMLCAYTKDATNRTIRLKLIIDGAATPQFDATSSAIAGSGIGIVAVGAIDSAPSSQVFQPIKFNTSLEVKVASSLSETDKVATGINYEVW